MFVCLRAHACACGGQMVTAGVFLRTWDHIFYFLEAEYLVSLELTKLTRLCGPASLALGLQICISTHIPFSLSFSTSPPSLLSPHLLFVWVMQHSYWLSYLSASKGDFSVMFGEGIHTEAARYALVLPLQTLDVGLLPKMFFQDTLNCSIF